MVIHRGRILMAASDLMPIRLSVLLGAGLVLSLAVILAIYSYFVWRRDPDKIPPAGTMPA
jgi:hypothetical protein